MNTAAIRTQIVNVYRQARQQGQDPKSAHTLATEKATELLGTVVGAWDLASDAQDIYGDVEEN